MLNYFTGIIVKLVNSVRNFFTSINLLKQLTPKRFLKKKPAKVSPHIEAFEEELNEALKALKKKLAPDSLGDSYVYDLPWYMVVGNSQSGKTSFIRNSGFDISPLGKNSIEDKTGTGTCNWWFSNYAVFLDTTGQFVTEDAQDLWDKLIRFLKDRRKKKPFDGLIITVDNEQIRELDNEALSTYAYDLRSKIIDELTIAFKFSFPVYLVFTKSDTIEGFYEFFSDLTSEERSYVWGATFSRERARDKAVEEIFESEFKKLFSRLLNRRLFTFSTRQPSEHTYTAFAFPLNFVNLQDKLSHFIRRLFNIGPSREIAQPSIRGFYFTSGIIDKSKAGQPQSYFIKNFLNDIVFPDKALIQPKFTIWTAPAIITAVAAVILITCMTISFFGNRGFIKGVYQSSNALHENRIDDDFENLDYLREYVKKLDTYENEGIPFKYNSGLYRGTWVNPPARNVYFERFDKRILIPVGRAIEGKLSKVVKDIQTMTQEEKDKRGELASEEDYILYSAYKTLTNPASKPDRDFFSSLMVQIYLDDYQEVTGRQADEGLTKNVKKQIAFYLSQFGKPDVPYLERNDILIAQIQEIIKELSPDKQIFKDIAAKGKKMFPPVNLERIMKGYRRTNTALIGDYEFSGIYTKHGWNDYVKEEIQKQGGSHSLQEDNFTQRDLIKKLDTLYFEQFINNWRRFFSSIGIKKFESLDYALNALNELSSGRDSSLLYLFGEFSSMTQKIDITGSINRQTVIDDEFRSLYETLTQEHAKTSSFENYLGELINLRNSLKELAEASEKEVIITIKDKVKLQLSGKEVTFLTTVWEATETLLNEIDEENRESVRAVLELPLKNTWELLLFIVQQDLEKKWHSEVCKHFNKNLKNTYPFSSGAQDASIKELTVFFSPESGVFSRFYISEIKPFFIWKDGRLEPKTWIGMGVSLPDDMLINMNRAYALSEGVFSEEKKKGEMLSFELCPIPIPITDLDRVLLKINNAKVDYRFQPQWWYPVSWPGTQRVNEASIEVIGKQSESIQYTGPMSFFKIIDDAQILALDDNDMRSDCEVTEKDKKISWQVGPYAVQYYLRFEDKESDIFLVFDRLSHFKCESAVADESSTSE
jgi:type VI secretion system protein ImpL